MQLLHADRLAGFARRHREAARVLARWEHVVREADWTSIGDVRQQFPHADGVRVSGGVVVTVFNIRGNTYRLLTHIDYSLRVVDVIDLLTHAEYDKEKWK